MNYEIILWLLVLVPAISGLVCVVLPSHRTALGIMCTGVFGASLLGLTAVKSVLLEGRHHSPPPAGCLWMLFRHIIFSS
ncbi:MAG TPA: hypothetical protein PK114_03125 [Smithellaceae bacterium]|nr:hypothetical protein [Smithellaceae bacterium]